MTVYILGGGPAGLALAQGLAEAGSSTRFIVFEGAAAVGGLAQTLKWGDHGAHDLGPHKIFTLDDQLMKRVEGLLPPSEWLDRPKSSRIWMRNCFLPYPPSPLALARVYGVRAFARMVRDYALAQGRMLLPHEPPKTFAADLELRVGSGLLELLFTPIAQKLWGDPRELDTKLSRGRVQTPKLREVAANLLGTRRKSAFEALTFRYPRGGIGNLWRSIQERKREKGEFLCGHRVTSSGGSGRLRALSRRSQVNLSA